jgi:hypothetical protein
VSVRQNFYSVPARDAGRRLPIRLAARTVKIYDGARLVAAHERAVGRLVEVLILDHYLAALKVKPGGLAGATALAQARARARSPPRIRRIGTLPDGLAVTRLEHGR